jgi:hypothetical protein
MAACLVPEPSNKGNHKVQFNALVPGNRLNGGSLFAGMAASYKQGRLQRLIQAFLESQDCEGQRYCYESGQDGDFG